MEKSEPRFKFQRDDVRLNLPKEMLTLDQTATEKEIAGDKKYERFMSWMQ